MTDSLEKITDNTDISRRRFLGKGLAYGLAAVMSLPIVGGVLTGCGKDKEDSRAQPTASIKASPEDAGPKTMDTYENFMKETFTPDANGNITIFLPVASSNYTGNHLAAGNYLLTPGVPGRIEELSASSNPNLPVAGVENGNLNNLVNILLKGYWGGWLDNKKDPSKNKMVGGQKVNMNSTSDSLKQRFGDYTDGTEGGDLGLTSSWELDTNSDTLRPNFISSPIAIQLGTYTGDVRSYLMSATPDPSIDKSLSYVAFYIRSGVEKRRIMIFLNRQDAEELLTAYKSKDGKYDKAGQGLVNRVVGEDARYNLGVEPDRNGNTVTEPLKPNEILAAAKYAPKK